MLVLITTWQLHQMETFSALLALCAGNSPVTGEFPSQRPVTQSFDVSFDMRLNIRFSKQSWGRWFETPSCSLWRHCNATIVQWWQQDAIYVVPVPRPTKDKSHDILQISWHFSHDIGFLSHKANLMTFCVKCHDINLMTLGRWHSNKSKLLVKIKENNQNTCIVYLLTHWDRVTHICVSKLTIIASDNGLSPGRRQANIWTSAGILLIGPLGTNFSEILIEVITFSFTKMRLKVSSAKWRSCCLSLNVLNATDKYIYLIGMFLACLKINMKHLKNIDGETCRLRLVMSQCTKLLFPTTAMCVKTASPNETFRYIGCQEKMSAQCHRR